MHANRVDVRRDSGLFAGPVYIVRPWRTVVSRPCGPTRVSVQGVGGKVCKAMPNLSGQWSVVRGQWSVVRGGGLIREGGRRTPFLSAKGREGARRMAFWFVRVDARAGWAAGRGHPQGVPLRVAGGGARAPTRGAPTGGGGSAAVRGLGCMGGRRHLSGGGVYVFGPGAFFAVVGVGRGGCSSRWCLR